MLKEVINKKSALLPLLVDSPLRIDEQTFLRVLRDARPDLRNEGLHFETYRIIAVEAFKNRSSLPYVLYS